jgi:hypothetical protein
VLRRGEVWLACSEIDDVNALLAEFVGLCHHGHRGGRLDAVDSIGEF